MNLRRTAAVVVAVGALGGGGSAAVALAPVAAADADKHFVTRSSGTCDANTGQWVITWQVRNGATEDAAISSVRSSPADSLFSGLPGTVAGGETVEATQLISGSGGATALLSYTATWADGTSRGNDWQFRPRELCAKADAGQ